MTYKVKLDIFEGPLDLLLFLIRKNEIDIYDIPIVTIAQQYVEYLELMKALNLEIAGEFLVMASTLTFIKSKMLLPPSEEEGEDESGEDPRKELVESLLEYQRFKELAAELKEKELAQAEIFKRGGAEQEAGEEDIWIDASIFDLLSALKNLLDKVPEEVSKEIFVDEISVSEKISFIMESLEGEEFLSFDQLFSDMVNRVEIIVTFLALLELIRLKMIRAEQISRFGTIRIYRAA